MEILFYGVSRKLTHNVGVLLPGWHSVLRRARLLNWL